MTDPLRELLKPRRLTAVVDIGANPIDGDEPPYLKMLADGLCRVTGFEPQPEALAKLQADKGPHEQYLPHVVGDGGEHTLHVCAASGMTSLLEPDPMMFGYLHFDKWAQVLDRIPVQTRRLDDITEIKHMDFLKIDIQGGELAVFQNGYDALAETVVVHTEVAFIPLYIDAPNQGQIDLELRGQGFVPHCFTVVRKWAIPPAVIDGDPRKSLNQIYEADIVYVRDFTHPDSMTAEQLKHLALIAHHCYGSVDLALHCIMLLEQRGALRAGAQQRYLETLPMPRGDS